MAPERKMCVRRIHLNERHPSGRSSHIHISGAPLRKGSRVVPLHRHHPLSFRFFALRLFAEFCSLFVNRERGTPRPDRCS